MASDKKIYIQKSKLLNGVLRYSSLNDDFKKLFPLDGYGTLRNRDNIDQFHQAAQDNGYSLIFEDDAAEQDYNELRECSTTPYEVRSPFLDDHQLFPFQHVGLNYVWKRLHSDNPRVLVQWDTGAGKTLLSCLTSQKLYDMSDVDLILVFCKKIKQYDWEQEFRRMTHLDVTRVPEKMTRRNRHMFYEQIKANVLVLNYEKVRNGSLTRVKGQRKKSMSYDRTDLLQVLELVKNKKVLIIIDEAQKINSGASLLGEGFFELINKSEGQMMALALTATPYTTSPLNIRNIFSVVDPNIPEVSDMKRDVFKRFYGKEFGMFNNGFVQELYVKEWDKAKLPLLGKKHENWTHIAMKSDPIISAQFPESIPKKIVYELSEVDRAIYDWAEEQARERYNPDNPVANWAYIDTLRMVCNTSAGLRNSNGKFAKEIVDMFGADISIEHSAKYQLIESNLEAYIEAGDKVVLFTFWTNGTLFPYLETLQKKFPDIPVLPIWGVGMDSDTVTNNIKTFNTVKGPAILITSDVGQEGLNLYAPYLWNIEVPRTYSDYKQRANRINRADSKSKGISHTWIYRAVAANTIEERADAKILRRRDEAEAIRGVVDENVDMYDTIDLTPRGFLFGD